MTAVANQVLTDLMFNQNVRDNLLQTMPGKATATGGYFCSENVNRIAQRFCSRDYIDATQTTTSTTYTDLATVGPTVTLTTGYSALIFYAAEMGNNTLDRAALLTFEITGASRLDPDSWQRIVTDGTTASNQIRQYGVYRTNVLNPGTNIFTMKYATGSAATTSNFAQRELVVMPL